MNSTDVNKLIKHIPNSLTLARLVMSIAFVSMILYAPKVGDAKPAPFLMTAFALFLMAAITDVADGRIARRYNVISRFGRTVDPLADKILVCGAFVCFAIVGQPRLAAFNLSEPTLESIRWGTAVILIIREAIVQTIRHLAEARGIEFGAVWSGKIKMTLQSFAIGTVLVGWAFVNSEWADWFTIITYVIVVSLTVFSGIHTLHRPIKPKQNTA